MPTGNPPECKPQEEMAAKKRERLEKWGKSQGKTKENARPKPKPMQKKNKL